jgi:UDP-glucose:(heptosyl)LPS alpha-1,3-glucosyltransferase
MRIAVLNRTFVSTGGGAERYSIALVEQLASKHEIHVFAQEIDHQWPGVTYHRLWTPLKKPRWINQLWFAVSSWWVTRSGFDVVHSHENTWHGQVQTVHVLPVKYNLFHGRKGGGLVLRWLKVFTSPRLLSYLLLEKQRYRAISNRRIVVTSPSIRQIMLQTYPHTEPMLEVLTPGVARVSGAASAVEQKAARVVLGLPTTGQCILFVANDYQKKGLPALLGAMPLLPSEAFLAVVGNAAHIPAFRKIVQESGLTRRVHFLGSLADMSRAYVAADCLAHPTLEDTFAMVVLEAMSHGLPVVVSDVHFCGISGLLRDNVDALILKNPKNSIEIGRLLERVLTDYPFSQMLIHGGLALAQTFLWSDIAMHLEHIYADAIVPTSKHNGTLL